MPRRRARARFRCRWRRSWRVDIGGTKLAAGRVTDDGRLEARASTADAARAATARRCSRALLDAVGGRCAGTAVACGVGCGGPDDPGRRRRLAAQHPGLAGLPAPRPAWPRLGLPVHVDNDAKALALGEGWRGAAVGERDFLAMVVSTGRRRRHRARRPPARRRRRQRRPHRPRDRRARRRAVRLRGPGLPRGRGVGHGDRRPHRPAAPPRPTPTIGPGPGAWSAGRVASVANLLDLRLAVVAGSVALGFGAPFFDAAQAELDRSARLEFSTGARIVPAGLGDDGPLVGAAAVALLAMGRPIGAVTRADPGREPPLASARCARRTRPRPRPSGRRSRPSWPSTSRPTGRGSGTLDREAAAALRHRVARDPARARLPRRRRWPKEYGGAGPQRRSSR